MARTATLLWIDHQEARICLADGTLRPAILAGPPDAEEGEKKEKRPNKAAASGRRSERLNARFFEQVAAALKGAGPLLLCGPSTAKVEFSKYLEKRAPALAEEVVAVQSMDHPTDRQLAAFARNYFAPPKK